MTELDVIQFDPFSFVLWKKKKQEKKSDFPGEQAGYPVHLFFFLPYYRCGIFNNLLIFSYLTTINLILLANLVLAANLNILDE